MLKMLRIQFLFLFFAMVMAASPRQLDTMNGEIKTLRHWLYSCRECKEAFELGIDMKCYGKRQCTRLIEDHRPECLVCLNELLDEETLEVFAGNQESYLVCDPSDHLQELACQFFCRAAHFLPSGSCERSDETTSNAPVCKCTIQITTSSTGPATTTSPVLSADFGSLIEQFSDNYRVLTKIDVMKPSGNLIFQAGNNLNIQVWNVDSKELVNEFEAPYQMMSLFVILPNGNLATTSFGIRHFIEIMSLEDGSSVSSIDAHGSSINAFLVLPNSDYLASASSTEIKIWNTENGEMVRRIVDEDDNTYINSLALLPGEKLFASGHPGGVIKIWRVDDGVLLSKTSISDSLATNLISLPNGIIASTGSGNKIDILQFNGESLEYVRSLEGHTKSISSLLYLPNTGFVASGSDDQTIKIWNPNNGELIRTLSGHEHNIHSLAYLPQSGHLVSAANNGVINIWNTSTD